MDNTMQENTVLNNSIVEAVTELNGEMIAKFNLLSLLRLWWFFIGMGLFIASCGALLIWGGLSEPKASNVVLGILSVIVGVFFMLIFFFPLLFKKKDTGIIGNNTITLKFYQEHLNINVKNKKKELVQNKTQKLEQTTQLEQSEQTTLFEPPKTAYGLDNIAQKAYGFDNTYRNETIAYIDMKQCFESKDFVVLRVKFFKDIIIFKKSQIIKGDMTQIRQLLSVMGKNCKLKKG